MKKILLTLGLMLSTNAWASPMVCDVEIFSGSENAFIDTRNCKSGDILSWSSISLKDNPVRKTKTGRYIVAHYCHQEKNITTSPDFGVGVCTYTGEHLPIRYKD